MHRLAKYTILLVLLISPAFSGRAQFKKEAFSQNYSNDADSTLRDTTDVLCSLRDYLGGLSHKNSTKVGTLFAGSMVFVGGMQIYNEDYWKLPLVYGSIGVGVAGGIVYRNKWKDTGKSNYHHISNYCFLGAGLAYWGTLMDGVVSYKSERKPHPGKATLYSLLVPGLGQAYIGDYWRIPIYYGALIVSVDCWISNGKNYRRFKRIYNEATTDGSGYSQAITSSTALYYRDLYRRYRDYSMLATIGFYLLQIIDANIFSYMGDFEVTDDIAVKMEPTIITPDTEYASAASVPTYNSFNFSGVGFKIGITF